MEKRNTTSLKIAITGPESTGKSLMAEHLAKQFNGISIPEYAREYVSRLPNHYEYADIENIARKQIVQYREVEHENVPVFFDTWLIITKVWFDWVYQKVPVWVEQELNICRIDLFLLMKPDIPWIPDPARENGGENRIKLFERYKAELDHHGFNYIEIGGLGQARFESAEKAVRQLLKEE